MLILLIALLGKVIVKCAKYFIVGFIFLWLLASCASGDPADNSADVVEYASLSEEYFFPLRKDCDSLGTTVKHNVEYFKDVRGDAAITDRMNQIIIDSVFFGAYTSTAFSRADSFPEGFTGMTDFNDAAKAHALMFNTIAMLDEGWEGYWDILSGELDEDWSYYPWYSEIEATFLEPYKHYLSYKIDCWEYTGGAHGNGYCTPIVFDLETGELVTIDDIVPADSRESLKTLFETEARWTNNPDSDYYGEDPIEYDGEIPDYFIVDSYGITWYTQPYEFGPWCIPLALTWEQLRGVVPDEMLP